jgi:hypothetical protein
VNLTTKIDERLLESAESLARATRITEDSPLFEAAARLNLAIENLSRAFLKFLPELMRLAEAGKLESIPNWELAQRLVDAVATQRQPRLPSFLRPSRN